jgi:hypothetical protein
MIGLIVCWGSLAEANAQLNRYVVIERSVSITDYGLTNDIVTEESLTSAETIESTILQVSFRTCFIVDCYV